MASVINAMSEAIKSLDYAVMALEAPEGASIRDTLGELIEARQTVANMVAALEDGLQWMQSGGEIGGVFFDEASIVQSFSEMIAKAKGEA